MHKDAEELLEELLTKNFSQHDGTFEWIWREGLTLAELNPQLNAELLQWLSQKEDEHELPQVR